MKVWRNGGNHLSPTYSVMISPGVEFPEGSSTFFDSSRKPILFTVIFRYGESEELEDPIAHYLIDKGIAKAHRFIL